jgi:proton-translocating NADH-quinone oxidoreductase chain N
VQALFIIFPFIAVILLNLPLKSFGKTAAFYTGLLVIALQIIMTLTSGFFIWTNVMEAFKFDFIVKLSIDFFSIVVLFLIGLIALVSLIVNRSSGDKEDFNFVNLVLLIMMGMNGIVMVRDLFSLYIFLEITGVSSFILISINKNLTELEGAFKYLIMSALATIFMLCAIAFIYMTAGSLDFKTINEMLVNMNGVYPIQIVVALLLFLAGLSIKAGIVPFHGWLPDAYTAAPSPVSILLAGIVTKVAGVYTLMRLVTDVFVKIPMIENTLMILGAVSIVVGALAAIGQSDFKRMLSYSSISQIGYIILGVAIGTPLGFAGALLHFFNHATFKSILFVNSTAVEMQTGTRDINKLGGLASRMPVTGGTSAVAFLSTSGIPPLSGFWSKLLIIIALWQTDNYVLAIIAVLASVLTLGYFLILQRNVFFGKIKEGLENVKEGNIGLIVTSLILSIITIAVGILFPIVNVFMSNNGLILK